MAVAIGIVLVASSLPAGATGTLDQSQEAQTDLNGTVTIGSQLAAQTFTAGRQGVLDQVDLLLTRYGNPGSLVVEIRTADAGVPTSQVIASGAAVDTNLDTDPYTYEWVSVVLSPAALVSTGTRYAIVVRDAGGAIFPTDYFVWAEDEFDPYASGMAVTSADGGATWSPATSVDFAFRTYVSTAGATTCLAKDGSVSNSNLQTIIDGANTGDTIVIKGVCVGNFSISGGGTAASLTLVGRGKGMKKATLDGNGSGSVVSVYPSETVTFKNLLITNGSDLLGGGISNDGTVNLCGDAQVDGNTADGGGGIFNSGTVTMSGNAQVDGNTANTYGGGIYNVGTVNLRGNPQVDGNTAVYGGGINNVGNLTIKGNANVNDNTGGDGGGIYNVGTVNLSGEAKVDGNTVGFSGGGIFNSLGTVTMKGAAQVNGNTGGGGINNSGTVTMSGRAHVNGNTVGDGNSGGGISTDGTVNLSGYAQVDGNRATGGFGGGIVISVGTLTMNGHAQVDGNTAISGGGIYRWSGTLVGTVAGVNVKSNIPDDIAP